MIKAKITVKEPIDLIQAYKTVQCCNMKIIKINNELNYIFRVVKMNAIYEDAIFC